jgi:Glycoside hydrolase family 44
MAWNFIRDRSTRARWDRMRKRVSLLHVATYGLTLALAYLAVRLIHVTCFRLPMRSNVGPWSSALLFACSCLGAPVFGRRTTPTLSVDVSSGRHAISREVYGIVNYGLDATYAKQIQVGNIRWGGDGTTRYNWQVDSSNGGFDWYFMGGNGSTNPTPSASVDLMIRTYQPADALVTIPIIPYVNKSAAWNCSFPVSVYGVQQSVNPYVHPNGDNCGNGIASNGSKLRDNSIYANHIDNSTGLQKGWLRHLVGTFGPASQGGVAFYQLDNEPDGWGNTHRDVLPDGADYPTITQLGEQYAAAIKQVDPTAMVLGPSDFTLGGWVGDTTKQNGLLAGQYYLKQMAAYEQQNGSRVLDYFDEHYYFDVSSPAAQLASTRTLWDPTYNGGTWVEQYVFHAPMQLIPRFRGWIAQYYPGTKTSFSEYSIDSGNKSIVDALAEMDVLGIFGREQVDLANMWSAPAPTDPIAYSFRMYRNYDGKGEQYGDTWVNATSSDQSQLSIYAAQRSSDNVVTVLVLNKTTTAISTNLAISGVTLPSAAAVYSYTAANLKQIVAATSASISNGVVGYTFPGYSATMFAFTPAATPLRQAPQPR